MTSSNPDVLGGTRVFAETRVPVATLFEYLEVGETSDDFLAGFPGVTRAQVLTVLQDAKANATRDAA